MLNQYKAFQLVPSQKCGFGGVLDETANEPMERLTLGNGCCGVNVKTFEIVTLPEKLTDPVAIKDPITRAVPRTSKLADGNDVPMPNLPLLI